jgi:hypothetical protein
MNLSAVSSSIGSRSQDFTALQNALQSGNVATAQRAFAAFEQDLQKASALTGPSSLFAPGTQTSKDLQTLGDALKTADLAGAQRAFATLKQDIQSAGKSASEGTLTNLLHHHHAHAERAASAVNDSAVGSLLNLQA